MKKIILLLSAMLCVMAVHAEIFHYNFKNTPLSEALDRMAEDHPSLYLNYIYNELGNYRTSATINTDNPYEALRQAIGLNPVSVMQKGDRFFVEALQHGTFRYTGRAIGKEKEPVEAATVILLSPKDSTVLTYSVTDAEGRFSIPCDRRDVIAKLSCVGYKTTFRKSESFNFGTIVMEEAYVQLNKVVVEADAAAAYSDKTVYRPSSQQKRAANTATDLLRIMAIPQIKINLINNSVTDNAGKDVSIYINGMQASSEELQGLPTADVRTVEYLEFPTDPRFKGAPRVINFIVQEYAYGGYTKASANENVLTGLSSKVNVFSKFNYKKMSYDIFAGANNSDRRHAGSSESTDFLLTDATGSQIKVTRNEECLKAHYEKNEYPLTFRATYNNDKVQIRNTLGFVHTAEPIREYNGNLQYSALYVKDMDFSRNNPSTTNSLAYSGSYYITMPKNFVIDVTPQFHYSHINDIFTYHASGYSEILRHARENAYFYRADAYLRKTINQKHSLFVGVNGGDMINRLRYTGNAEYTDKFHLAFASGILGYNYRTSKISLNMDAGVCWEGSDINGKKYNDVYPWTHINLQYSFSKKHLLAAYFQFATDSPGISHKASDVLQDNEFLYITGNPYVKNARHITLEANYTWLPANTFSMSAYTFYHGVYNRLMTTYSPYNDGKAILRDYTNNGNFNRNTIGLAFNLKLFNRKLQIYMNPEQNFFTSTGIYKKSYNPFTVTAQAMLYVGHFYFQAYYKTPQREMAGMEPSISRTRNLHLLGAGWSANHWNIRLTAYNFLNKGWINNSTVTESLYFSQNKQNYGTNYHPRINLSVTYTIHYGKKVQTNNEVGQQGGASSAILK